MKLNFLASLRSNSKLSATMKSDDKDKKKLKRSTEAKEACCQEYDKGNWNKPDGHDGRSHYCYFCYVERNNEDTHPSSQCTRGPTGTGVRR